MFVFGCDRVVSPCRGAVTRDSQPIYAGGAGRMPYAEGHVARARPRVVKYLGVGRTHKIKKEERIAIIEIEIRYIYGVPSRLQPGQTAQFDE